MMSPDKVAAARRMYESKEFTIEAIVRVLGVSRASIYRHFADAEKAGPESLHLAPPSKP
ncbi:MAG: helix-turn-helix domain-containing protein [Candidatus Dormibacteria bacterium]